jgi:tetratricopeptide (TPR) repeat protein
VHDVIGELFDVPVEFREQEVNLAYARLYSFQHQHEKALDFLRKMKSTYFLAVLDSNRLKLMIYYDMPDFEEALMELDRGIHYIKNNPKKIPKPIRAYSEELFDKYRTLIKLKLNPDKYEAEML